MSPEEWLKQEQERMKAASKPAETEAPEPKLPAADVDFGKKTAEFQEKAAAKQKEDVKAMREEKPMGLPDWMRDTLIATGAVAAATLAGYTGYKRGKRAEQIAAQRGKPPAEPMEPTFDATARPSAATPTPAQQYYAETQGVTTTDPLERQLLEKSFQNLQAKQAAALTPTQAPAPTPVAPSTTTPAPVAPSASQGVDVAPSATPAPAPAPAPVAETEVKKSAAAVAPPKDFTAAQKSAYKYIAKSQKELGITNPQEYLEFVRQVMQGQIPEMGPKGGAPVGFGEKMGEFKKGEMMPLSQPERTALRAKGIPIMTSEERAALRAVGVQPPSSQKGGAKVKDLLALAGVASLLGIAATPESRAAMQRAGAAVQDLGVSPDIFANKAEELGRMTKAYVNAGNPNYRAELEQQLAVETNPARRNTLISELMRTGQVGAGRGVMPPEAYMR